MRRQLSDASTTAKIKADYELGEINFKMSAECSLFGQLGSRRMKLFAYVHGLLFLAFANIDVL